MKKNSCFYDEIEFYMRNIISSTIKAAFTLLCFLALFLFSLGISSSLIRETSNIGFIIALIFSALTVRFLPSYLEKGWVGKRNHQDTLYRHKNIKETKEQSAPSNHQNLGSKKSSEEDMICSEYDLTPEEIEHFILEALKIGVISAVSETIAPNLPVRMTGARGAHSLNGSWIKLIHIPSNIQENKGSKIIYQGILRILLNCSKDTANSDFPAQIISSLSSYFGEGMLLTDKDNILDVIITRDIELLDIHEYRGDIVFPLSFQYKQLL